MRILNFGSRILDLRKSGAWALILLFAVSVTAYAYPPAPHHTVYGLVRDQWGNPFTVQNGEIILTTENGTRLTATIVPGAGPGVNYRLRIPMDAGIAPDIYSPTALKPLVPFRIEVKSGGGTYLPIQMQGGYETLGQPAEETRIDLTLGIDSEGDGLPDAWKDMVIAMHGGGLTRADIRPHDDLDGDGRTNFEEYIAGTYAWDPADRFYLDIVDVRDGSALVEFTVIDGRTYSIYGSRDLEEWTPVNFRLPDTEPGRLRNHYFAPAYRILQAEVPMDSENGAKTFFRLKVE